MARRRILSDPRFNETAGFIGELSGSAYWSANLLGGCHPAATHCFLTMIAIQQLSCNAITVARPPGVCPTILVPSVLHVKCSHQCSLRGLNRRTRSPVTGSSASCWSLLKLLHRRQASQRFSSSSEPPFAD